jgi:hypothetical protein
MAEQLRPHYPIYIPSKNRYQKGRALTIRALQRDRVPFYVVVEQEELAEYAAIAGRDRCLVLPWSNRGSVTPARNWIMEHAIESGAERHWQLDDNMNGFYRFYRGKRLPVTAGVALAVCEAFADRYENLALAGLNYDMFVPYHTVAPLVINCHVYSCTLVDNAIPYRWRPAYNEDTDLCLQVLSGGWCTALLNGFTVKKKTTMKLAGGNTDQLYRGDGRLRMARSLERDWPYVVEVRRRFERPQHVVRGAWRYFDTPLRLKPGIDLAALPAVDEMGITLREVSPIQSERLAQLVADRVEPRDRPTPGVPSPGSRHGATPDSLGSSPGSQ